MTTRDTLYLRHRVRLRQIKRLVIVRARVRTNLYTSLRLHRLLMNGKITSINGRSLLFRFLLRRRLPRSMNVPTNNATNCVITEIDSRDELTLGLRYRPRDLI